MDRLTDIFGRWIGLCALALTVAGTPASRAQSVVTLCTQQELEARIAEARDLSGDGLVTFECDGVILLTNTIVLPFSLLEIETDDYGESVTNETELLSELTLDGTDRFITLSGPVATNASNGIRLFLVDSGVTLSLININLVNGQSTNGGAVYVRSDGRLLASGCVFSNNVAITTDGVDGASAPIETDDYAARSGRSGGSGATAAGGAVYNLGFTEVVACSFLTNGVVGGNGGSGGNGGNAPLVGGDGGGGGRAGSALGGAVYNQGELGVFSSRFFNNTANGGFGGIGGTAGTGPFPGFEGHGGGGGATAGAAIYNHLKSRAVIVNSTFGFNIGASGDSVGGGSSRSGGKKGPTGPNSSGGALANFGTNVLVNCSFFANLVVGGQGGEGGAGRFHGGNGGSGGVGYGGNVFNGGKRALMLATNCTFADGGAIAGTNGIAGTGPFRAKNGAKGASRGGNIANSNGVFHLKNCLIAYANPGTNGYGKFKDAGFNFSSDRSIKLNRKLGSITNADPHLDILRANGGPVETMELLSGSRAIDAGDTNFILSIDARGVSRPLGARGDIGAYEAGVILGPPRIVTQPVGPQIAREGATIVFSVVAEGDPPLLYQWSKDGVEIDGETSPTLMLSLVDDDSEGEYTVEVSNNSGSVTSEAATLDIIQPAEITEDLIDEITDLGGRVVLSVTAEGDTPLNYLWLTNGVLVEGVNLSTFTIDNAAAKDDMDYQVVVCNVYGCATSSVAHVTVQAPTGPAIQTQPADTNVFSGEAATFSVVHTGSPPLLYQWFFNSGVLAGATNEILTITNVQSANAGSYHLVISNSLGSATSSAAALTVSNSAPILISQSGDVEQDVGTAATFSITAMGSKPLTFQWYQTTIDSSGNPTGTIALTNGLSATFIIPSLAVEHEGTYKCVVSNPFGTVSSDVVFLTEIFCNVGGVGVPP